MLQGGINLACFFMHLCTSQHLLPFKGLLSSCRLLASDTAFHTNHSKAGFKNSTAGNSRLAAPTPSPHLPCPSTPLHYLRVVSLSPKPSRRFSEGWSLWSSSPSMACRGALPIQGPSEAFAINWELPKGRDEPYSPLPTTTDWWVLKVCSVCEQRKRKT